MNHTITTPCHRGSVAIYFALLFGLSVVATCSTVRAENSFTFVGFEAEQLSDEARQGLENIFAGRLFHEGIPAIAAKMGLFALAKANQVGYDPGSTEGGFYAFGQCPSPPNRTDGGGPNVPLGASFYERDGMQLMGGNCMACHAGIVNGLVVAGLGNSHINQSNPGAHLTRGDNFGPYGVWRLVALLEDPASQGLKLAESKTELLELFKSAKLAPVDPQPWWLMKYKTKDYWYADAGPHDAASFSINFTTPHRQMNELHAAHVKVVATALAFARETQSPLFPEALNADLVKEGADLFHGRVKPQNTTGFRTCKSCHGSYEKYSSHTDLSQPGYWTVDYNNSHVIRDVKTDLSYNSVLQSFQPIAAHATKLRDYYKQQNANELLPTVSVPSQEGYVAPPLVGIWATAPYFHNGSVPTIETVLNSKSRPGIWERPNDDPHAYNLESVGMAYRELSREEFEQSAAAAAGKVFLAKEAVDHGAMYDTAAHGHGNMGHTFGDSLSNDERMAIIEFLKSLSGPDMKPIKDRTRDSLQVTSVDR